MRRGVDRQEQARFGAKISAGDGGLIGSFQPSVDYPYVAGLRLAQALLREGGQRRLDAAFSRLPLTSEQVLHPEQVGEASPPALNVPAGQGKQVDQGSLGELGLALLLDRNPLRTGGPQAGWDGDRFATYERGGAVCTYADVRMSSDAQRDRLVKALQDRGDGVDARATGPAGLMLRSCRDKE